MDRINYYSPNIGLNRKALKEVWEILNAYEEKEKVPDEYMWIIEDNMDKEYCFTISNLDNMKLMRDTKAIFYYIYMNFLASEEEKEVLEQLVNLNKYTYKQEKVELEEKNVEDKEKLPIEYKEEKYNFIYKIKKILNKILKRRNEK